MTEPQTEDLGPMRVASIDAATAGFGNRERDLGSSQIHRFLEFLRTML